MKSKVCTKCYERKPIEGFHRDATNKDGRAYRCKACYKTYPSWTKGKIAYFKKQTWSVLNKRTVNGTNPQRTKKNRSYFQKGIRLEMTGDEFYSFCDQNKIFIEGMYKKGEVPTIDRIDDKKHYSLENIQVMSLSENVKKSNIERKGGKYERRKEQSK